ncbi:MAG: NnrU family protein [Pseudomonadota bacterium]
MSEMWLAAIIWVVSHLGMSSTPLRGILVGVLKPGGYLALYSLVAAAALVYLIYTYNNVPRFDYLWLPNPDLYWLAKLTMPIAFILLLGGFLVKNPTNVGMAIDDPDSAADLARGVTRITRHPLQWAIVIWGAGHVVANGDWVSIIFFSSFIVLSGLGGWLIDRKKAVTLGPGWAPYAAATSNIPFLAIAQGRNKLVWSELWLPILIGLVAHGLVYYFHEAISGAVIV